MGGRWTGLTAGEEVRSSRRTTPIEKTSDAAVYSPAEIEPEGEVQREDILKSRTRVLIILKGEREREGEGERERGREGERER
jgi:hypothetical protein